MNCFRSTRSLINHKLKKLSQVTVISCDSIVNAYRSFKAEELCVIGLCSLLCLITFCCTIVNHLVMHYPISLDYNSLRETVDCAIFCYISCGIRTHLPRAGNILVALGLLSLLIFSSLLAVYMPLSSPMHLINSYLGQFNHLIHFNQSAWIEWTYNHPTINALLKKYYDFLEYLLFIVPVSLILLGNTDEMITYINANIIAILIGYMLFFIFPNLPPAAILTHTHHLPHMTYLIIERYYAIHKNLPFNSTVYGLIPFPSFHVIWSMLCVFAVRKYRILATLIASTAVLIILSTMLLGWHYAADVVAGIAISSFSYYMAIKIKNILTVKQRRAYSMHRKLYPVAAKPAYETAGT